MEKTTARLPSAVQAASGGIGRVVAAWQQEKGGAALFPHGFRVVQGAQKHHVV